MTASSPPRLGALPQTLREQAEAAHTDGNDEARHAYFASADELDAALTAMRTQMADTEEAIRQYVAQTKWPNQLDRIAVESWADVLRDLQATLAPKTGDAMTNDTDDRLDVVAFRDGAVDLTDGSTLSDTRCTDTEHYFDGGLVCQCGLAERTALGVMLRVEKDDTVRKG